MGSLLWGLPVFFFWAQDTRVFPGTARTGTTSRETQTRAWDKTPREMTPLPPCCAALGLLLGAAACSSDKPQPSGRGPTQSPDTSQADPRVEKLGRCAGFNPEREPFFGDTHVHTRLSLDANLQGNRLAPIDAYRFARGEEIGIQPYSQNGEPMRHLRISRPLDFVALSDHAEFLGLVQSCTDPKARGYDTPTCREYRDNPDAAFVPLNSRLAAPLGSAKAPAHCAPESGGCRDAELSAWREVQDAAEAAYDRTDACAFTSFVAYEWSGSPGTKNLHRNVIFRNHSVPELPASYFSAGNAEALWEALRRDCLDPDAGCDVLTIPHNSNLSAGLMFEGVTRTGEPFNEDYAKNRAAFEPLVEIFQHKGDSECLPGSPATPASDELCTFEKLPYANLATANLGGPAQAPAPKDFVRDAVGAGMLLGKSLGTNPFAYGFIASTDTHLGVPGAVEESTFPGHGGAGLTVRDRLPPGLPDQAWFNPGGLAVLWAEENSREALFSAMRRREAYGTSGTRITLRFFGGWDYDQNLCDRPDFVAAGYKGGVPMGGVLSGKNENGPRFLVSALRDSMSVPLSHVQVIKGFVRGDTVEFKVFNVAGDPDNGADVDSATCRPTGPSGAGNDSLCAVWTDDTFDPTEPALYYVRVLENPTCRWHAYACNEHGVNCSDPSTVTEGFEGCCEWSKSQRERAWSSPIWYTP